MSQIEPTSSLPKSRIPTPLTLAPVPPWSLVVIAVISVQFGAAVAKQLFETAGSSGVVFLRTSLAAGLFVVLWRPRLHGYSRQLFARICLYGFVIGVNMLLFYATIDRIPLGVAVAIAFTGPLGVAVWGSRKVTDFAWIILAAIGILLLSPLSDESLDPLGLVLALLTAVAWGTYIMMTKRMGHVAEGRVVLALGMCIAALVALPFGIGGAVHVLGDPVLFFLALVVAVLSSAIPVALEFQAMRGLSPYTASLLLSLEPVVATVIGVLVLHEALEWHELAGILLITVAAVGTTRTTR